VIRQNPVITALLNCVPLLIPVAHGYFAREALY
jgi:hypothetical protein